MRKNQSGDTDEYMDPNSSLKQFTNMATLFKMALLILPPTTSNIERGFSLMNLIFLPLRMSFSQANLDHFMQICINGPDNLENSDAEEMVDIFNRSHGNKHLDLRNLYYWQR